MNYSFILYGTNETDLNKIGSHFSTLLDIDFEERSSDYFGDYILYKGLYADKISIENNFSNFTDNFNNIKHKKFPTLVSVSISGKIKDVKAKTNHIFNLIKNKITYLEVLECVTSYLSSSKSE